jgi:peptide/nickel transport system ATP-binding protein
MYAGRIVEHGKAEEVLRAPQHPYTRGLLDSVPATTTPGQRLRQIPGSAPSILQLGVGCAFTSRCTYATEKCSSMPAMSDHRTRQVRCWHPLALTEGNQSIGGKL